MRLLLLLIATLCLILTNAQAATTVYNYANRTQGTDIFAHQYDGGSTEEFTSSEYDKIEANDGVFQVNSTFVNFTTPTHFFVFKIDEAKALVSSLNVFWNGKNSNGHNGSTDGTSFYIYNYSSSSYALINSSFGTSEITENWTISSNVGNYIGGTNNNEIILRVQTYDTTKSGRANYIYTDFAQLTVNSIDPPHHYEIFHDAAGKTCASESVTIKACTDAACSSTVNYATSLNFKVNGSTQASPSFTGQTSLSFNHSTAESVALSLDGFSLNGSSSFTCDDGAGGASCAMAFDAVGCLHHYQIEHDGAGSACASETVTIKACSDASCSSLFATPTTIQFKKDGLIQSSPSFTGSTTVNFNHTSATTVALSLANASATAPYADSCVNTSGGTSCSMAFVTTGCIDHYQVQHDGTGSTCAADTVTVKACANSSCSVLSSLSTSLDVKVNGAIVGSPSFTGSTNVSFSHGVAEAITLALANPSIAANNAASCENTAGGTSCVETFSSAGCSSLVADWRFDEGSGQTVIDSSGNGHNGTLGASAAVETADPSWQCEQSGYTLNFTGSEFDKVTVAAFAPPTEAVLSFWLKVPSTPAANQRIMGSGNGWEVRHFSNGKLYFDLNHVGATLTGTNSVITPNVWTHVVGVFSTANSTWKIYLNGVLDNSGSIAQSAQSSAVFTLGLSSWQPSEPWDGALENVKIYSGVLTDAEIAALAATPPATCSVDHYQIEHDGNGSTCQAEAVTIKACANAACSVLSSYVTSLNVQANGSTVSSPSFIGSTSVNYQHTNLGTVALSIGAPLISADNAFSCVNTSGGTSCNQSFSQVNCPDCSAVFPSAYATSNNSNITLTGNPTIDDNTNGVLTTTSLSQTGSASCLDGVGQNCSQSGTNGSPLVLPNNTSSTDLTNSVNVTAGDHYYRTMTYSGDDNLTTSGGGTARLYFNSSINIGSNSNLNATGTPNQLAIFVNGDINIPGTGTYNAIFYATGKINVSGNSVINGGMSAGGNINVSGNPTVSFFTSYIANTDLGNTCVAAATPFIHHYWLEHDGSALTCAAEPITIKACLDSNCNFLYDGSVALNFQVDGITQSSPVFVGSTNVNLAQSSPTTVTLGITNPSVTATDPLVCSDGGAGTCQLVFADTGFQFLSDGVASSIPTQLSGKPSNQGYNARTLALQAIKKSPITGACEAALTSNVVVELAAECRDPASCGGQQVSINGLNIATQNDSATPASYTNVSLDFGTSTDNSAAIVLSYPDAGKMQLHARYNIPVSGSPSGNYMTGSSNDFVVRPLGFYLDLPSNPAAQNANGSVFKKAGAAFTVTVTAMQWQAGDDNNNDGVADSNALLSNNSVTASFGQETSPATVQLSSALIAPVGGVNVSLNNASFAGFSNGALTRTDVSWPEVGVIQLSAGLASGYLGSDNISGLLPYVGRFIPDYFQQTVNTHGSFTATCTVPNTFAYIGEKDEASSSIGAIRYLNQPAIDITAYNLQGAITQNYRQDSEDSINDFMKLKATDINITAPTLDAGNGLALTTNINQGTGTLSSPSHGVLRYQFPNTDNIFYTHNNSAKVAPFISQIDFASFTITDSDSVPTSSYTSVSPTGINIKFARQVLENSFAPETANLPQPMRIEYFNGTNFVLDTDNGCTGFDASKISLSNISLNPALSSVLGGTGLYSTGETRALSLQAPGVGNQGQLGVSYDAFDWLKYDWDANGLHDNNPAAVASFGQFRGNDRVIYWREINQ